MKRTVWWAPVVLAIMGMIVLEAGPARSVSDLCPMGGVMINTLIVKEKALDWAKNMSNAAIDGADTEDWTVLARSRTDQDIAMLVGSGYVFFSVAGRGGEVYPQDFDRAFGKDLGKLRAAVKQEMNELWKAGVVRIEGSDLQQISDAVGRGLIERDGSNWVLKTRNCQAVDLPASGL